MYYNNLKYKHSRSFLIFTIYSLWRLMNTYFWCNLLLIIVIAIHLGVVLLICYRIAIPIIIGISILMSPCHIIGIVGLINNWVLLSSHSVLVMLINSPIIILIISEHVLLANVVGIIYLLLLLLNYTRNLSSLSPPSVASNYTCYTTA